MNKHQQGLLKTFIKGLKTLAPYELRMSEYSNRTTDDPHDCGTVACVAGWGPRFLPGYVWWRGDGNIMCLDDGCASDPWRVMQTLLGLTYTQARYLFDDEREHEPRDGSPTVLADAIMRCEWVLGHPTKCPHRENAPERIAVD